MRISDWSSDVCSSDLPSGAEPPRPIAAEPGDDHSSEARRMTQVGFIGLGMMGMPMADRLLDRGFTLTVQDADPARVAGFLARHANARGARARPDFAGRTVERKRAE